MSATYDTTFAHAVRRAARGIKQSIPKAKANGARLAAILRDGNGLDEHGWKLFRQGVTGKLRKPYGDKQPENESEFAQAVREAFEGACAEDEKTARLKARKKKKNREIEGAELASMLQIGLEDGERELLAQMVTRTGPTHWYDGMEVEQEVLPGAPPKGAMNPIVTAVVKCYRDLEEQPQIEKHPKVSREEQELKYDKEIIDEKIRMQEKQTPSLRSSGQRAEATSILKKLKGELSSVNKKISLLNPNRPSPLKEVAQKFNIDEITVKSYIELTEEYEKTFDTIEIQRNIDELQEYIDELTLEITQIALKLRRKSVLKQKGKERAKAECNLKRLSGWLDYLKLYPKIKQ